jgi:hypothetical protein
MLLIEGASQTAQAATFGFSDAVAKGPRGGATSIELFINKARQPIEQQMNF